MKKMNKPEVEAIRFDSNDVIATSGMRAGTYATKGREIDQWSQDSLFIEDDSFYTGTWNGSDWVHDSSSESYFVKYGSSAPSYAYAWYNESAGTWYSDGVFADKRSDYPEGND